MSFITTFPDLLRVSKFMIYLELLYYYLNPRWELVSYTCFPRKRQARLSHWKYFQHGYVRITLGRRKFQFSKEL